MSNKQFVVVIRGIQGSGKSTIAKVLKQMMSDVNPVIVESDDYMVDANGRYKFDIKRVPYAMIKCKERTLEVLSQGGSVITVSVLTRAKGVRDRLEDVKRMKVPYVVLTVTDEFDNQHNVPEDVVEATKHMWESFENEVFINSCTSIVELKEILHQHLGYELFQTQL